MNPENKIYIVAVETDPGLEPIAAFYDLKAAHDLKLLIGIN